MRLLRIEDLDVEYMYTYGDIAAHRNQPCPLFPALPRSDAPGCPGYQHSSLVSFARHVMNEIRSSSWFVWRHIHMHTLCCAESHIYTYSACCCSHGGAAIGTSKGGRATSSTSLVRHHSVVVGIRSRQYRFNNAVGTWRWSKQPKSHYTAMSSPLECIHFTYLSKKTLLLVSHIIPVHIKYSLYIEENKRWLWDRGFSRHSSLFASWAYEIYRNDVMNANRLLMLMVSLLLVFTVGKAVLHLGANARSMVRLLQI